MYDSERCPYPTGGALPRLLRSCLAFCAAAWVFSAPPAWCGEWRVYPIRLHFEPGTRIGTLNVRNDGDDAMNFQVKAMEWTQDPDGKDAFTETNDLIFFPKLLLIPPREERVIRLGLKGPGGPLREKTYRLFVEEIAPPRADPHSGGAVVAVNIRFAVPVFVQPVKEDVSGQVVKIELFRGTVSATLRNSGNVHFRVPSLVFRGKDSTGRDTFSQTADGWYLLTGSTRAFSTRIPAEACRKSERIEVEGATDRALILRGDLMVDRNQCN
ncbi:MAG: molecular chaperone [Geobacteraceae bacterium]|nr:molecular chaperone [Geobacteraceae bacterium]